MNLNQLFMTELENGIYEQWLLSPISLTLLVLGKMIAHWLLFSAPLILLAPLLGYTLLQLNSDVCIAVGLSLLLATPTLALLGGIIAALTANLRDSSLLLPLVLLPLCIPSLIFGVGVVTYALQQSPYQGLLALLAAQAVLTLTLAPIAIASALRLSVQT
jgi:heme exporter protein B